MATTYSNPTGTSAISNLVQTAYDRLIEYSYRAQPIFRNVVDKRPAQQAMPGSSVVFQIYKDMDAATTALTENVDPDAAALSNTSTVSVTLAEYGNAAFATRKLELLGLADVDPYLAQAIGWNMVDSLDVLVQNVLAGGTQFLSGGQGSTAVRFDNTAPSAIAASAAAGGGGLSSNAIRFGVARLRGAKVPPKRGNLYAMTLHPEVSVDLRQETGAAAWRDPHNYTSPDAIWAGEIGQYEGAFFVENPRCYNGQATVGPNTGYGTGTSTSQVRTYLSYLTGLQAVAEAVAEEPHMVVGPVVDKLQRFRPVGWYGVLGWSLFRTAANSDLAASTIFVNSSSVRPTT